MISGLVHVALTRIDDLWSGRSFLLAYARICDPAGHATVKDIYSHVDMDGKR